MADSKVSFLIGRWPGKIINGDQHPALWHMLDVAAVAEQLVTHRYLTDSNATDQALLCLVALHDLGKVSEAFYKQITGQAAKAEYHAQLSFVLLQENDQILQEILGGSPNHRRALYASVAGHHGGPPKKDDDRQHRRRLRSVGSEASLAVPKIIRAVTDLFTDASLDGIREINPLTWRLSGLTVQADWIGSNSDWFGPQPPDIPIDDYWTQTRERAVEAVANAGLHMAHIRSDAHVLANGNNFRPMQRAVQEVELPAGPTLALIEDATGSGKTEASMILSHRMMVAGKGKGLFFALPTMATSNAMLERITQVAPILYSGRPSLGLSHSRAAENDLFRQIRGNDGSDPHEPVTCGQWLSDDRRRILFADLAVGTIDQALLSVMPTRFNTLRLWALSGKIIVVDEAHAYDRYMEEELGSLLRFQAMLGGSAIVMTATLPERMRNHYVMEFQKGLGLDHPQEITATFYPQLTLISQSIDCRQPAPVPSTCRNIRVVRVGEERAMDLIADGASKGAACVWIRNAVDDAIATMRQLHENNIEAELLHARFIVADRLEKERHLQDCFGPDGCGRAGKVLVATQVVEASLDLDFDLMVSDLAPIGSLIQRAGRLWRHMEKRPVKVRTVDGPCLYIVSPDPELVDDDRWLHDLQPSGAWVYPLADQWRTARTVFDAGVIHAPDGLRYLIEAVHGSECSDVPEALVNVEIANEGNMMIERSMAQNQMLRPGSYLDEAQEVYSEDRLTTRLGIPQITLWLARRQENRLIPYAETWEESEVRMSRARYEKLGGVDQECPQIVAIKDSWPEWRKSTVQIAPVDDSGVIVKGLNYVRDFGLCST